MAVEQKVYSLTEHKLSKDRIDPDALYILEKLRHAGFIAYLVGGSVRDLLLNRSPKDYDISTSAEPEEIKKVFRNCILIGRRFRLAHIRFGKKIIEVSTFRSGDLESDSLIVRDNEWGSQEEDVMRRDFTINGLFYDSANETIIDYVGGYLDLQKELLRTIGQPFLRFKQDPVRMLRLLKFQARFSFKIEDESHIAMLECRSEITKSSPARILEEVLRMLESGSSASFFHLITEHGFLQFLVPSLAAFMEADPTDEIFSYLEEIDAKIHEFADHPLRRSILLSCLGFPMMQQRIKTHYIERNRTPHLGEIQNEAHNLIHEVFSHFFQVPRRIKFEIASIFTSQYRLTPIESRTRGRKRIPHDAEFPAAIEFLQIRAAIEPGLESTWKEWDEAYRTFMAHPRKPRARRLRKKKTTPTPDSAGET